MAAMDMMGGAFGLELPYVGNFPLPEDSCCAWVNSGRGALECLLRNMPRPHRVLVPLFACDTLLEPLRRLGLDVVRYRVSDQLEPIPLPDASPDDLLLLVDYFGLWGNRARRAAASHPGPVVMDATMALYAPPVPGIPAFYSPRKFGGLADGGVACAPFPLVLPEDEDRSAGRSLGMLQRLELGAVGAVRAVDEAERELSVPVRRMSPLTRRLIAGIDWRASEKKRVAHYMFLHAALKDLNRLDLPDDPPSAPFCYPLVSGVPGLRDALVEAGIALPLFWPEVIEATEACEAENRLARTLLPLPLDQRYSEKELESRLLSVICA